MQPNYQQYGQGQPVQYQPFPYVPPSPQQQMPNAQLNNIQMQFMGNYQQVMVVQVKNGLQKLTESPGIYIKQKFEVLEALTGCETPNVYKVFPADANGKKTGDNTIFKCKEKSSWCERNCLAGDCRPFNMKVSNEEGTVNNGSLDKTLFLHLDRPFKCTCMCFARPEMSVNFVENGTNTFFGKVKNPCLLCSLGCDVEDSKGNLKYIITGTCCQIGYLCMGLPCKSCQEFLFEVRTPSGDVVTRLQKQSAGCLKACVGDADNFALGFPQGASPEDKALLMASALFLDYMYFENKQQSNNQAAF